MFEFRVAKFELSTKEKNFQQVNVFVLEPDNNKRKIYHVNNY
jgi:hypothetical protein